MKERPILFSAPMVRAILEGRKTQTRRVVKCNFQSIEERDNGVLWPWREDCDNATDHWYPCPYGQTGDRLWVRETHAIVPRTAYAMSDGVQQTLRPDDNHDAAIYREGWERSTGGFRWRPSIHMPRWASRILLEVVSVRVERLRDISEADAKAEGVTYEPMIHSGYVGAFCDLWSSINGRESWDANPWVWVVEFRRVSP